MARTMGAAKFKEQCLAVLERLTKDGLIITKHGKPVAKVIPIEQQSGDLIGKLSEKIRIKGDIESTGIRWDAES